MKWFVLMLTILISAILAYFILIQRNSFLEEDLKSVPNTEMEHRADNTVTFFDPARDIVTNDTIVEMASINVDDEIRQKMPEPERLANTNIAEELADACKISVNNENASEILARLSAYAQRYNISFDPELELDKYKSLGPEQYLSELQVKYSLSREDLIDLLCSATVATVKKEVITENHPVAVMLAEKDIEINEVASFINNLCSANISNEQAYNLLQEISHENPEIDIDAIDFNETDMNKLINSIAQAFGTSPELVKQNLCSRI